MLTRFAAVLLVFAVLVPAPASAQKKRDYERARDFMESDPDYADMLGDEVYKHLTPAQQKELEGKIIRYIAQRIRGKRRGQIEKVDVVWGSGESKKQLEAQKTGIVALDGKYQVVELKQDVAGRAKTTYTTRSLDVDNLGNLFADNEWTPKGPAKMEIEAALAKTVAHIKSQNGVVTRVLIRASASTLRNTQEAAGLTYAQLSAKRAEEARKLIEQALSGELTDEAGKPVAVAPEDITVKGQNGDGTSGPGSPFPCPSSVSPEVCSGGNDEAFDAACGTAPAGAKGLSCSAGSGPGGEPAEGACEWLPEDDEDEVDCGLWKQVRALRSKPRAGWTKEEVSAVREFYAPFKYVQARICATFKGEDEVVKPGEAHMVLALVEVEPNRPKKIRKKWFSKKFKPQKPPKGKKPPRGERRKYRCKDMPH